MAEKKAAAKKLAEPTKHKFPVDMNTTFFLRKEDRAPQWHLIDATDKVLGRLATEITETLRGKDKAHFTPFTDGGDYVVVINADKVMLTGNKLRDKEYVSYSGWIGGQKTIKAVDLQKKKPEALIEYAVKGMLPKNRLSRQIIKKLKVYAGSAHPHKAQIDTTNAAKKAA